MKRIRTKDPHIIMRENGSFYYRKGNKELSLKTTSYIAAVKNKENLLAKNDPMLRSNMRLTFGRVVDDYLESRKQDVRFGKIRESTYQETYMILGKHLEPYFRKVPIAKIRTQAWDDYRSRRQFKDFDMTNHRKVLSHFMKWAVMHDYIHGIPIFPLGKIERRKRRILKPEEMASIWQHASGGLRLFISMALLMGMRRSEIIKLNWANVNLDNKSIYIASETTKTGESRWIPIAAATYELLVTRKKHCVLEGTPWVFPNLIDRSRHASVNGMKGSWATCKRRAGLSGEQLTWHDLRATCEYYAHKRLDLTATQLEKFFGSSVDIQRKIYVSMGAEDLRGVEQSVSMNKSEN